MLLNRPGLPIPSHPDSQICAWPRTRSGLAGMRLSHPSFEGAHNEVVLYDCKEFPPSSIGTYRP